MELTKQNVNQNDKLAGFGLHDAQLIGFSYEDEGGEFVLRFRSHDGRVVVVSLHGVGQFGMVGLQNGAIVSDLFVWAPAEAPLDGDPTPRTAWSALYGDEISLEHLVKAVEAVVRKGEFRHLILLECSYGGAMAALCQSIDVQAQARQ